MSFMQSSGDHVRSVSEYLEEARELSRRGRYSEAIALLKKAQNDHKDNLYLRFENAETHATQGYINRAYDLTTGYGPATGLAADMLRMLKCFLEPMIHGRFLDVMTEADQVRKYDFEDCADMDWLNIVRRPQRFNYQTNSDESRQPSDYTITKLLASALSSTTPRSRIVPERLKQMSPISVSSCLNVEISPTPSNFAMCF